MIRSNFWRITTQKGKGNDHELYEDERTIGPLAANPEDTMRQLKEFLGNPQASETTLR